MEKATEAAKNQLAKLEQGGAKIIIAQADVSQREQLARVLAEIDDARPLRGVIHAAGVLDDGLLLQQSIDRFAKVFAAKISGAWNLHTLTENTPLDFFVLFSSIASLLGSPGQANHAAANAFLDALAYYRRALGLTALSINWGVWDKVGAAAKRLSQIRAKGMGTIAPEQGVEILKDLLSRPSAEAPRQVGVVPINWSQFRPTNPFFAEITQKVALPTHSSFRETLATAPADQRHTLLIEHVREQVAQVLGWSEEAGTSTTSMPLEQGFFELGMDSLTSMELRNRLQTTLKCRLPSTLTFKYPTVEALVDYLAQEVLAMVVEEHNDEEEIDPLFTEEEDEDIDNLSSEEGEEMAKQFAEQLGLDWEEI